MQSVDYGQALGTLLAQQLQASPGEFPRPVMHEDCDDEIETLQHRHHRLPEHHELVSLCRPGARAFQCIAATLVNQ